MHCIIVKENKTNSQWEQNVYTIWKKNQSIDGILYLHNIK
jgi:hypothetical protein